MQLMPYRSSRLKITPKLLTQTPKPAHVHHVIHKDKVLDSDIKSEDDEPHGGDGIRPLTTCQAVLASIVKSLHVLLGASLYLQGVAHLDF